MGPQSSWPLPVYPRHLQMRGCWPQDRPGAGEDSGGGSLDAATQELRGASGGEDHPAGVSWAPGQEDYTRPCPPPVAGQGACDRPRGHCPPLQESLIHQLWARFWGRSAMAWLTDPVAPCAQIAATGERCPCMIRYLVSMYVRCLVSIRYKSEHRQESLFKSLHRKQNENHL